LAQLAGPVVFAVTMFPIPLPFLGVTSHLCATPLLALLLGWRRVLLPTFLALAIQALFLGHGGLTTLGANTLTLAIVGPLAALGVYQGLTRLGVARGWAVGSATLMGDLAVYALDAVIVAIGLSQGTWGGFTHWLGWIVAGLIGIQGPLALLEALLSVWLVHALSQRTPELLSGLSSPGSVRKAVLTSLPLLIGVGLVVTSAGNLSARAAESGFTGLDERVFEASAIQAGQPPVTWQGWLADPEIHTALLLASGLGAGILIGRTWERLSRNQLTEKDPQTP
jgi:cobalt/nickel transport system permease protein